MTENEMRVTEMALDQPWDLGTEGVDEKLLDRFFAELALAANSFSFHPEDILDTVLPDPKGRMFLFIFSMEWIRFWGSQKETDFDPRDELAGKMCRVVQSCTSYQELCRFRLVEGGNYEKAAHYLTEKSMHLHRTLMQAVTGLILHVIRLEDCSLVQALCREVTEKTDYRSWEHLPLI